MTSQARHSEHSLKAEEANKIYREKQQILSERRGAMQVIQRCCMLCDHMTPIGKISNDVTQAICLKHNIIPPLKIITCGCPNFEDEIPF